MRLAPAIPLLLTDHGCPLAFDVVDADAPRPQPIIGRATYEAWETQKGVIWYTARIQIGDQCMLGTFSIPAKKCFK